MGIPACMPSSLPPDPDPAGDSGSEQFRRRMAEQGMIIRMANPQPDWEPAITLDVPADELSATVVSLRRGGS
jgi:malic enzyme